MDIATLTGLTAGILIISAAVFSSSDISIFLDLTGFLIVVGGTASAVLIKFPLQTCAQALLTGIKTAFVERSERPQELIQLATQLSRTARKHGHLAMENVKVRNPFFSKGLHLIIDGHKDEFVRKVMTTDMTQAIERHMVGERVFRAIGETAPALGMIGTLVGLVQMLVAMDDPAKLGVGMAVALLTTLYGALIAHLVAIPIADKLDMRAQAELRTKELIIESLINIQKGENPVIMEEILSAYLPGNQRQTLSQTGASRVAAAKTPGR